MDAVETVIIGAGVIGLAVGRAMALAGKEVLILESEDAFGTGTSSRNSEVIHAGIYYPAGSLKARLCVEGRLMMYDYCHARGIPHQRCGKLIVATSQDQIARLSEIQKKSLANGVVGADALQILSAKEAKDMEPELQCLAALWSPSTGIVDSHALMLSYLGDLENAGGLLALQSRFESAKVIQSNSTTQFVVRTQDGTEIMANQVINAAGLYAPQMAKQFKGTQSALIPKAFFAKGSYFSLSGRSPFSRLIYPVPEAAGLGVHLTLDMAGQAKFGPDVEWVDSPDCLTVEAQRGDGFYAEVRKYWPGLKDGALIPAYAGIRPKINSPYEAAADFCIQGPQHHGTAGLVHLMGIESPGLTSSLAIADEVVQLLA
jgi:L-2-hydroxyglutarate oxidase LhgO